jgi:predicted phage-related endonuclease
VLDTFSGTARRPILEVTSTVQQGHSDTHNLDRRLFIGGSHARIITGDDEAGLVRLWREKRGEVEPEDLSDVLVVQLGTVTEDLNRR